MTVVVVESPAKAKTINKYLGKNYKVLASYGHVRDLPSKDGSVDPDNDFEMVWQADTQGNKRIKDIADALKGDDKLILATDPDREGEAISWHLIEALKKRRAIKKDTTIERVAFNAITKTAVMDAIQNPRNLDMELIEAYLARRALDYLVGFTLSPVLWRKLPGSRSAGRVQSVALRIVCERETEIEAFKPQEYWSVTADMTSDGKAFPARLVSLKGESLDKFDLGDEAAATAAVKAIKAASLSISAIDTKPAKRNPPPPFTTSTLQQEASRKLGMSPKRAMMAAQKLYEGVDVGGETVGLITYMRTDGVSVAPEAIHQARDTIKDTFGNQYLPKSPRMYKTKAKNAQEAHEAIRPTNPGLHPNKVKLDGDMAKLYTLIWNRMMASQMAAAELLRTRVDITDAANTVGLRANGQIVKFDGFLKLYEEGRDDAKGDDDEKRLPALTQGADATADTVAPNQHFTEPPPRYSEASLVKRLEELGIGRPSTYASTIGTLQDRDYVRLEKGRLIPEDKGRLVTAFLKSFFARYVETGFTAELEDKLDQISAGDLNWKVLLAEFWKDFSGNVAEVKDLKISEVLDALNETLGSHVFPDKGDGSNPRACPSCDDGLLSFKLGKFGAFIGCSNYPDCRFTRQLAQSDEEAQAQAAAGDEPLGQHPDSGEDIFLKSGRFGPYVELASDPLKRASLPKGWAPDSIDMHRAVALLSLPRDVGEDPETGEMIKAGIGRYGPYVQRGKTYASLSNVDEVFDVGINRAVSLIADKAKGGGRKGPEPLKELGDHDGKTIKVMSGRYGPYVTDGKTNASLPKGTEAESVTMEQALALIDARAKAPKKKKAPAKKKTAAKKPAAKKKAT